MFRSLPIAGVLIMAGLSIPAASAQNYDDGQYRSNYGYDDGQYRSGNYGGNTDPAYDYARVVRVDPIIVGGNQGRNERCYQRSDGSYVNDGSYRGNDYYSGNGYRNGSYDERGYDNGQYRQSSESGRQIATVIGGLAGAVLGSQIGGGDGRYLGTAVGSIAGGAAGRAIYEASTRNQNYRRGDVRVCEPSGYGSENERVDGYDVTYEYGGREYHTRRDYHPGERIRVRVDVTAD